jgi:hypothetical protein
MAAVKKLINKRGMLTAAIALLFTACGGGGGSGNSPPIVPPPPPPPAPVTNVNIGRRINAGLE